jgi:hypothetical protein
MDFEDIFIYTTVIILVIVSVNILLILLLALGFFISASVAAGKLNYFLNIRFNPRLFFLLGIFGCWWRSGWSSCYYCFISFFFNYNCLLYLGNYKKRRKYIPYTTM